MSKLLFKGRVLTGLWCPTCVGKMTERDKKANEMRECVEGCHYCPRCLHVFTGGCEAHKQERFFWLPQIELDKLAELPEGYEKWI